MAVGLQVDIDRDTAGRLGITPQNVDDTLYDAFGQRQVSTIFTQSNQYHVILEAVPQWQLDRGIAEGFTRADRARRRPIWPRRWRWRARIPR